MELPLAKRIRKKSHRDIAWVQDMVVETLLEEIPEAVFHGGTCIWRCHSGNRFSDDLDFYLPKKSPEPVFRELERKGFQIKKKKISERSLYSTLVLQGITIQLEGTFREKDSVLLDYEKLDGTIITIEGLTKEQLLREKVHTYLKRNKVRDLYDVFFLLRYVKAENVKTELQELINNYTEPVDEADLRTIILQGITPSASKMFEYIKRK